MASSQADSSSNQFGKLETIIQSIAAVDPTVPSTANDIVDDTDLDYMSDSEYEYSSGSDSDYYDENRLSAQKQWEESLKQINGLFSLVIFPLIGKVLGRRFSHIIWNKFSDWWFI